MYMYKYKYINTSCQNHQHHSAVAQKLKQKICQRLSWDPWIYFNHIGTPQPAKLPQKSSRAMAKQAVACQASHANSVACFASWKLEGPMG